MKWPCPVLIVLLAVLVGGCGGPPQARDRGWAPPEFGVQFHGTWTDYDDAEREMVLDALVAHGVTTVRIDVSWRMLEPERSGTFDEYGLEVVDNAIQMAADRNLRPLVTLWMAPEWANGSGDERVPPTSAAGLAGLEDVASRLAIRYRGVVDAWEVWNEPNDDDFMTGADPEQYADLLSAAYHGFKEGDPNSTVVFGGTSYIDVEWIRRALAAGAAGHFDVMGVHPYLRPSDAPPGLPDDGSPWRLHRLPALVTAMAAFGDGGKPIWFTEFGWSVHPNTPQTPVWDRGVSINEQAAYAAETIDIVRSTYPMVTRVYWYRARAESPDPERAGYGLVYPDGQVAPALSQMPDVLSGGEGGSASAS